jgi:hypothetical protein
MVKKIVALIVLTVVISFSLILSMPILILSETFSNYDSIDKTLSYYYTSSNTSSSTELNLLMDRSQVEVVYIDSSNDYSAKIEIHLELSGANVQGKSYLDYFNIVWQNESSQLNFTMVYNPSMDPNDILLLLKDISTVVYLRQDAVFNINAVIDEGKFDLLVPFMVTIENVNVNLDKGDIFFNFFFCQIGGNITGTVRTGNIDFIVKDVQYTQNGIWNLTIDNGDLLFDVFQQIDIGANITGSGQINVGELRVYYKDSNPRVGALFTFHNKFSPGEPEDFEGFHEDYEINEDFWWLSRFFYYSSDFPSSNYYNISLYKLSPNPYAEYFFNLLNTNTTI